MEEKNQKRNGLGLKEYLTPLTATGSAFCAGASYLVSFPIATAHNILFQQMPEMADGKVLERVYNSFTYGCQVGGELALVGGIAGLMVTVYGRDWVQSVLGIKKR
jgi:hypothetical protein